MSPSSNAEKNRESHLEYTSNTIFNELQYITLYWAGWELSLICELV